MTALTLACYIPACAGWHTQQGTVPEVLVTKRPSMVRVIQTNGDSTVLHAPRATQDSLLGMVGDDGAPQRPAALPLAEVAELQVKEMSSLGTAALVVGVLTVGFSLLFILLENDHGFGS